MCHTELDLSERRVIEDVLGADATVRTCGKSARSGVQRAGDQPTTSARQCLDEYRLCGKAIGRSSSIG